MAAPFCPPCGGSSAGRSWQDHLVGRPLEYDALTGAVVRSAESDGLDVPADRMILGPIVAIRLRQKIEQR